MILYDFNGVTVEIEQGEEAYVVTNYDGDCVSLFKDVSKFRSHLERGIWNDAIVYHLAKDGHVEVVQK